MRREVKSIGLGCGKRCWWKAVVGRAHPRPPLVAASNEGMKGWRWTMKEVVCGRGEWLGLRQAVLEAVLWACSTLTTLFGVPFPTPHRKGAGLSSSGRYPRAVFEG